MNKVKKNGKKFSVYDKGGKVLSTHGTHSDAAEAVRSGAYDDMIGQGSPKRTMGGNPDPDEAAEESGPSKAKNEDPAYKNRTQGGGTNSSKAGKKPGLKAKKAPASPQRFGFYGPEHDIYN